MATLRRIWFRAYPTVITIWLCLVNRALALDVSAVDQEGGVAPSPGLVQTYEKVRVSIADQVAGVQTSFQFRNDASVPLELTYQFRLGQRELVDGFSYWNGSERIVGEVLERRAASDVYTKLAGVRRDPAVLEQNGDQFRFRVFPVAVKELKPVELTSTVPLRMRDGFIEYVIPRENLPAAGATFAWQTEIVDTLPIAEVVLQGFVGKIERQDAHRVRVSFETVQLTAAAEDLKIRYRLDAPDYALRLVTHRADAGDGSFMLIVSPKGSTTRSEVIGRDVVFVTDISGSMSGIPLSQTKAGLLEILTQLSPDDRFEVISFDDDSYPVFGQLVAATEANRKLASASTEQLEVRGGTNISGALLRALDTLKNERPERPRAIVFLTDGQGDAPAEVVAQNVHDRAGSVRIYSFGVGTGVNRAFLQRLADDNRGSATFVQTDTQIASEMKRLYARIAMPLMLDLRLDFGGLAVSNVYPKRLPDLYRDNEVVVFGRYKPGAGTIKLRGRLRDGDRSFSVNAKLPDAEPEHAYVEKLWAAQRVDELLSTAALRGEAPELTQEITRLGIVYDLVTPYTAFVAVPASAQTEAVKAQLRAGRRGYDKRLIDTLQGIHLSQVAIPPGDPILTVDAPADAREVTAYFPFGAVKPLAYDSTRTHWVVRFLVPRDVLDGHYTVTVRILDSAGHATWKNIDYAIDSTAPELDVRLDPLAWAGEPLHITVDPLEPVKDVYATLPGVSKRRVHLKLNVDSGLYEGDIPVPLELSHEQITVRVVAHDRARNQVQTDIVVPVSLDGC